MRVKYILAGLVLLFCLPMAMADRLYKWVDDSGRVTYHDLPPPQGSGYTYEEKTVRGDDAGGSDDGGVSDAASQNPVVLYSVPKCPSCDLARAYLQKRKTPFKEINVAIDPKLQNQLKKISGALSVPTITVGKKVMTGYIESLLEGELVAAGYPKPGEKKTEDET